MIFAGTKFKVCAKHDKCLSTPKTSTMAFFMLAPHYRTQQLRYFRYLYPIAQLNFITNLLNIRTDVFQLTQQLQL